MTDVGKSLFCRVTASNAAGSASADSNTVGPVTAVSAGYPSTLPGLIAWYRADAGVYFDAGTTLATDGQIVSQWNDQSGGGAHISPGTGFEPLFDTTGFNTTHPAVVLNPPGGAYGLATAAAAVAHGGGGTFSAFVVCQMLTGTESDGRLIAYLGTGDDEDYADAGSAIAMARAAAANAIYVYHSSATLSSTAISLATNYRLGSIFDGANHTMYVNNVGSTPVACTTAFAATGLLAVGYIAGGAGWAGPIAEVVITNTALDSTQRTDLDNYFKAKWGLT